MGPSRRWPVSMRSPRAPLLARGMRRDRGEIRGVPWAPLPRVAGRGGRGVLNEVGLAGSSDVVVTTTLSKALGSQGGAVLGSEAVRDHLIDSARPFIFDT